MVVVGYDEREGQEQGHGGDQQRGDRSRPGGSLGGGVVDSEGCTCSTPAILDMETGLT